MEFITIFKIIQAEKVLYFYPYNRIVVGEWWGRRNSYGDGILFTRGVAGQSKCQYAIGLTVETLSIIYSLHDIAWRVTESYQDDTK